MTFKINIANNGKTWKLEVEAPALEGKAIGDKIDGKVLKPELEGYELEITGGSDKAGFPMYSKAEGVGLSRVLFTKGWGFSARTKEGKLPKGIRKRKTVRGRVISEAVVQINMNVLKKGNKKLEEIFPDQNKPKAEEKKEEAKSDEQPQEQPKEEQKQS